MFPEGRSIGVTEALHGSVPDPVSCSSHCSRNSVTFGSSFCSGACSTSPATSSPVGNRPTGGAVYSSSASCSRTSPPSGFSKGSSCFRARSERVTRPLYGGFRPSSNGCSPISPRRTGRVPERSHLRKHAGVGRVRAHCWRGKTVACVAGIRGRRRRDRLALAARLRGPLPRRRRGRSRSRAGGTGGSTSSPTAVPSPVGCSSLASASGC